MKLYSNNEYYKLYQGNMLDILEAIEPNTIDSIITDPPYELNFMNKSWDNSGIAFQKETWQKCYEVLKSGGYLLAFGGSRTFHRIACAIEDAGFEIRDTIMWLYGSGFPKSHNIGLDIDKLNGCPNRGHRIAVANRFHPNGTLEPNGELLEPYEAKTDLGKKWNGWGTALKPSFEPIIVARKPLESTVAKNCLKWGVGGINIDECRVAFNGDKWKNQKSGISSRAYQSEETTTAGGMCEANENGRFPANTILTYDETDYDEVCGGFPDTKGNGNIRHNNNNGKNYNCYSNYGNCDTKGYEDSGSASRYFYCAKASKKDRDEGLDEFEEIILDIGDERPSGGSWERRTGKKPLPRKNIHPTVKPTELMQYLIRLVSPNGSTILDPFNGSGSTGKAVMYENKERNKNYKYVGIELIEEYLPISKARIEYVINGNIIVEKEKKENTIEGQLTIFDY